MRRQTRQQELAIQRHRLAAVRRLLLQPVVLYSRLGVPGWRQPLRKCCQAVGLIGELAWVRRRHVVLARHRALQPDAEE